MDPVAYLQKYYKDNKEKVKRMQTLIRSRVFELHYAREGPYELPPLALSADGVHGGEFAKMVTQNKDGKSLYYNKRGNISLESTEYNKGVYASHRFIDPKVESPGIWVPVTATTTATGSSNTMEFIPKVEGGSPTPIQVDKNASPPNNWPLCGTGTDINDKKPCRDAYDIIVDYSLGFHSKTVKDERVGHVPSCWIKGRLSADKMHCLAPL